MHYQWLLAAQAEQMAAARKIQLPDDFLEAAKGEGLRKSVLEIYFKLQVSLNPKSTSNITISP